MNNDLSKFTDDEIAHELDQRKRKRQKSESPKPLDTPDFSKLIQACTEYVEDAIENDYFDEDVPHYIYEAAMEAVYGSDYFKWHNARLK